VTTPPTFDDLVGATREIYAPPRLIVRRLNEEEREMKKLAVVGTLMGVMALAASEARADYNMAGCGLGSMAFHENTMGQQILAATTNGLFGTQTFGITSGTSNCASGGIIKAQREQAAFAEVNFQDLKRNMAAGGGEFLTSFASLLGCEDSAKPALAQMAQAKYELILPTATATPMQLVAGVKTQINADTRLAGSCSDERAVARAEGKLGKTTTKTAAATAAAPAPAKVAAATAPAKTIK
jgi:hypothetical protein